MRARRLVLMVAAAATIAALAFPSHAAANGGAYIEFDETHYLPGERAVGTLYASIPAKRRDLLDQGPFHAYLLTGGATLREGRPIPTGAIRVGTWTVALEDGQHEFEVAFTVPEVAGDFYDVGLCNDPCTLTGLGETFTGQVSVVATTREAALLRENGQLHAQLAGTRRDLRKAGKGAEEIRGQLQDSEAALADLSARADSLEANTASAETEDAARALIDPWAAIFVALGLGVLAAALMLRRKSTPRGDAVSEGA